MKFLCGNCKAKYQIADEKVSGRTLRMKCRRCGHDILIDGHSMAPASAPHPHPAPAQRRGSSSVSVMPGPSRPNTTGHAAGHQAPRTGTSPGLPRPSVSRSKPPSGLSAEFRRHVAAPPEVPQRTAPYDLWHVAIQDVPVGPMTRDELSRKIDAGAVTPESLCWREGMDDWRPLGDLPELAGLLRRSRDGSRAGRLHRPPPEVPASHGSRAGHLPVESDEGEEDGAEPTRISEFQPPALSSAGALAHGTHAGHHAAPGAGSSSARQMVAATSETSRASLAPIGPQPVAPAPAPAAKSGAPVSGAVLLAIGLLLGAIGCAVIFLMLKPDAPTPASTVRVDPGTDQDKDPPPEQPVDVVINPQDIEAESDGPAKGRSPSREATPRATKPAATASAGKGGKPLTAEEIARIKRMSGGASDPDLSTVGGGRPAFEGSGGGGGGGGVGPALTQQQLTKVVQDNKTQLQRCYETALRASGGKQDGTLKISVSVVVGGSGITKSVNTQGDGLGNMTDCIRRSVKGWRFPQSGGESEFAFPLVFQPGA